MNKIKVIDLLNMISKGEEVPKRINFCRRNFEYKEDIYDYLCTDENFDKTGDYCLGISICKWIFPSMLNEEVEIIEEQKKIPEKLTILQYSDLIDLTQEGLIEVVKKQNFKINEIIDFLKSKGE